jgi:hypothetical protein
VKIVGQVRISHMEHRTEHPVRAWQRSHRRDQLVAHPGDEEGAKTAGVIRDPERRISRPHKFAGRVHQPLQDLSTDSSAATANTASDTARSAGLIGSCMSPDDTPDVVSGVPSAKNDVFSVNAPQPGAFVRPSAAAACQNPRAATLRTAHP